MRTKLPFAASEKGNSRNSNADVVIVKGVALRETIGANMARHDAR